ncbi:MAG: DUF429 domain-containing protein [Chloroflexi bacterium]|nr:DUF429 domain-containing protein [Chloroflexota bacterium]
MPVFVGLDLAWTPHHESGLCALRLDSAGFELIELSCRIETPAAFAAILAGFGPDAVAAVDAPLVRTAACTAERELARAFGRYRASAYNANTSFLERKGLMAGPQLGDALRAQGFSLDPSSLAPCGTGRVAFEMYPHAAHVVHFSLAERLKYKKGRLAGRLLAFVAYQAHLRGFAERTAPGLAENRAIAALLDPAAIPAAGRALKAHEDQLDALTCALVACRAWRDGVAACEIFGSAAAGYIAVPGLRFDSRFGALHALRCTHPHEPEDAGEADLRGLDEAQTGA